MAWGLREVYYLSAGFAQLLLAYLIVRSGERKTVRTAFGVVFVLSAIQAFNLYTKSAGLGRIPAVPRKFVDTGILVTLAYLVSQFPRPIGGERGARIARRAWLGVLALGGLSAALTGTIGGLNSDAYNLHRDVFHHSGFAIVTGLFTLHFVPRWFETDDGPLRTQSLFVGVALAASSIDWGLVALLGGLDRPTKFLQAGVSGTFFHVAGWFALAGAVRIALNAFRSRDREAWMLLALTGVAVFFGINNYFWRSSGVFEVAAHVFRPVLLAVALLRFELVDIPSAERRWAVPVGTVLFAGLAFLMAVVVLSPEGLEAQRIQPAAAFGGVLVVGGLAWASRDVLATELAAPSPQEDRGRALERYRLAVQKARNGAADRDLPGLREDLGITDTEHELVLASLDTGRRFGADNLRAAEPGDVIGDRYEVDRELGQGGEGRALAAWDRAEEEQVVLKEALRPWEDGAEARRRALERQIELVGGLDEPGLATVHGIVDDQPRVYLVRDYVPGRTLDGVVQEEGPLGPERVGRIVSQLAGILERLHDAGLLHLDLKPSNIVLQDDGTPVVIDHGTVQQAHHAGDDRSVHATRTMADSTPVGTLAWMAPEQLLDDPLDPRADVFALGALTYFLVTGKTHLDLDQPTFRIEDQLVRGTPPEDLEGPLGDVVQGCLARDRDERPGSMAHLAARVQAAASGSRPAGRALGSEAPAPRDRDRTSPG